MRPDLPCAIASRASTRRVVSYCFGAWLSVCLFCVAAGTAAAQTSALEDAGGAPTPEKSFLSAWSAPEPWRTDRFYLQTSLYTRHFNTDAYHNDHQNLIGLEWNVTERWLVAAAAFDNSFGQPSQFVYGGLRLRPFDNAQPFYIKIAAGVVHGYKGEYQHKIPLNGSGVAPVITASVGYCVDRLCSELALFGTAGVVLTAGVTIP